MWRLCQNGLAVRLNLAKRGIKVNPKCPFCAHDETVEHMVLQCEWTHLIWFVCLDYKPHNAAIQTFDKWLIEFCCALPHTQENKNFIISSIAYTCWYIWLARNEAIFQKKNVNPAAVIHRIQKAVAEYHQSWQQKSDTCHPLHGSIDSARWCKPPRGSVKLNIAVVHKGKLLGMAFLARDCQGEVLHNQAMVAASTYRPAALAETTRKGLQDLVRLGYTAVEIETSDKEIIGRLRDQEDWRIEPLVSDIKTLQNSLSACSIQKVAETANKCALCIAKWASDQKRMYWTMCPSSVYARQQLIDVNFDPP